MYVLAGAIIALAVGIAWRRRYPKAYPAMFSLLLDTPLRDVGLARTDLARRLGLGPRMRVLEIGPGSGFYTEALATGNHEIRLVCLDLQPAMLHKVRQRLGPAAPHLVCGSASALPFRAGSFERILLMSVLGEVPDRAGALRECARLLSADGALLVAEGLPDPDYIPPARLVREARDAGLVPLDRVGAWLSYTQRFRRPAPARRVESGATLSA